MITMARLRKIPVRDERLWRWGMITLIISSGLVAVGIVARRTTITIPGLFLVIVFLLWQTGYGLSKLSAMEKRSS